VVLVLTAWVSGFGEIDPPQIHSVSPMTVSAAGARVTIRGLLFENVSMLLLGDMDVTANISMWNGTTIVFNAPPLSIEAYVSLTVVRTDLAQGTATGLLYYFPNCIDEGMAARCPSGCGV
jgi:hypothetical protein